MYVSVILASVGTISLAGFSIYAVLQNRSINKEICGVSQDTRTVIRNILKAAREERLSHAISPSEIIEINRTYDSYIALAPRIACNQKGGPIELEP